MFSVRFIVSSTNEVVTQPKSQKKGRVEKKGVRDSISHFYNLSCVQLYYIHLQLEYSEFGHNIIAIHIIYIVVLSFNRINILFVDHIIQVIQLHIKLSFAKPLLFENVGKRDPKNEK